MTDRSLRRSLVLAACFSLLAAMVTVLSAGVAHADGFHVERWTGAWGSDGPIITGDFNGDGKTDVMMTQLGTQPGSARG
jgi:hypothetical protein